MYSFLIILGLYFAPTLTLGCVLIEFDHPVLGVIAVVLGVVRGIVNNLID